MNGATVDGRKPIVSERVHDYGHRGAAGQAKPKAGQVAAEGAANPGTGKKAAPAESQPALAGRPEVQDGTRGTTAEEQRKRLAQTMYPSSNGLRRYGAGA